MRVAVEEINAARRAHINAILANGGYFQIDDGIRKRQDEIAGVNEEYDALIQSIVDPQEEVRLEDLPVMAAGIRALDNARWEFQGALEARAMMREMGAMAA